MFGDKVIPMTKHHKGIWGGGRYEGKAPCILELNIVI